MKFIMLIKSILSSMSALNCRTLYNPACNDKIYDVCVNFSSQKKSMKKTIKEAYSMPIEKFFKEKKNS